MDELSRNSEIEFVGLSITKVLDKWAFLELIATNNQTETIAICGRTISPREYGASINYVAQFSIYDASLNLCANLLQFSYIVNSNVYRRREYIARCDNEHTSNIFFMRKGRCSSLLAPEQYPYFPVGVLCCPLPSFLKFNIIPMRGPWESFPSGNKSKIVYGLELSITNMGR